ncbi:MAG: glycosyltransferase family 9 protein, partial [Vulcanimicrobiaceae bacterium]
HREALLRIPDIDDVLLDDGSEDEVVRRVRDIGYDAVIVTWATARTARIAARSGIQVRVGQARRLYSSSFTHRVTVRSERGDISTPWVQILLDYARAIDCDVTDDMPRFVPTEVDRREAQSWLAAHEVGPFVLLHATNAIATQRKLWPTSGWSALARSLAVQCRCGILLSGSRADDAISNDIAARSGALPVRLSIGAFGALATMSRGYCGITTGSMHIAAAVGAPTLGIFPFQSDVPDRWGPHGPKSAVVRASYPCHPGDTKERCPDYACIEHLDVDRIVAAFCALIHCARPSSPVYSST